MGPANPPCCGCWRGWNPSAKASGTVRPAWRWCCSLRSRPSIQTPPCSIRCFRARAIAWPCCGSTSASPWPSAPSRTPPRCSRASRRCSARWRRGRPGIWSGNATPCWIGWASAPSPKAWGSAWDRSPAATGAGWPWPRHWWPNPMCCCSMNPPTISTRRGWNGCRAGWIATPALWCSSPTTGICWIASPGGLWRGRGVRPATTPAPTPPTWNGAPRRRWWRRRRQAPSVPPCAGSWPGCARVQKRAAPSRRLACNGSLPSRRPRHSRGGGGWNWRQRPSGWGNG